MLELLFCTFVAPLLAGAHVLPGTCSLSAGLAFCASQRITYIYDINATMVHLIDTLPCRLDWVGQYNGTLYFHPKCKDFIKSIEGSEIKLPSKRVCKVVLRGHTLLVVGNNWFLAYDLKSKVKLVEGKGFSCPATLSPNGQFAVLRDLKRNVMVVIDLRHGGLVTFTIPFKCWRDADWGKGGLALTRPGSTWFNSKIYPYGGQKVVVGDKPYMIDTSPYCEGVLTIVKGRDYCIDLGFVPSSISVINDSVAVSKGGIIIFIDVEGSLMQALRPSTPT